MLKKSELELLSQKIEKAKSIVITTHVNPDGDAIGSSLGLYHFLLSLNKKSQVIVPNAAPDFLSFLQDFDKILNFEEHTKKCETLIEKADIIFVLDYNVLSRGKTMELPLEKSKAFKMLIDHHLQPGDFADITYSDTSASSTCQLVAELIEQLNMGDKLNSAAANALYTGIMTDTGSFRFDSCTPKTHRIVANLLEVGANKNHIHQAIYDTHTENRMRLLGFSLAEKLTVLTDYKTAFISLSLEEQQRFEHQKGDTDGLVNFALSVNDIQLAAFFVEREDEIKISFRSKNTFDANTFARKHFKGGGHFNAAGGHSDLTLDETIMEFIKVLPKYKVQLNKKLKK